MWRGQSTDESDVPRWSFSEITGSIIYHETNKLVLRLEYEVIYWRKIPQDTVGLEILPPQTDHRFWLCDRSPNIHIIIYAATRNHRMAMVGLDTIDNTLITLHCLK